MEPSPVVPDPIVSVAQLAYGAVMSSNWRLLGALALVAVTLLLRAVGAKHVPWLRTDRGGAVLVMAGSFGGALLTALLAGAHVTPQLLVAALSVAWTAAGGYSWFRKVFGISSAPAAAPATVPPSRGAARVVVLPALAAAALVALLFLPSSGCTPAQNEGWKRFGTGLLNCATSVAPGLLDEGLSALSKWANQERLNGDEVGKRLAATYGPSTALCIVEKGFKAWGGAQLEDGTLHGEPEPRLLVVAYLRQHPEKITGEPPGR